MNDEVNNFCANPHRQAPHSLQIVKQHGPVKTKSILISNA